jgi:hypothetical protein
MNVWAVLRPSIKHSPNLIWHAFCIIYNLYRPQSRQISAFRHDVCGWATGKTIHPPTQAFGAIMREEERFTLPCPISHLLIYVGYIIFGSIYLLQLWDYLVIRVANTSLTKEVELLVALTENELHGRSKEDIMDLLNRTRYPPYYKFGFRKYDNGYECILYAGIDIVVLEDKFVSYDVDSIGGSYGGTLCSDKIQEGS